MHADCLELTARDQWLDSSRKQQH